jgi:transcriptional regulator with XRE-family HTH domain
LNERIKQLRKELGLTLEKFGERLGVSKVAISLIENGKNALTDQMFKSICREFNVREEWLRNGDEPMFNGSPQTVLDELCEQYDLDTLDKQIVDIYISLPKQLRDSVKEHIKKVYFNGEAKKNSSGDNTVQIRAAHMNPGATQEQIDADNAMMESDDF